VVRSPCKSSSKLRNCPDSYCNAFSILRTLYKLAAKSFPFVRNKSWILSRLQYCGIAFIDGVCHPNDFLAKLAPDLKIGSREERFLLTAAKTSLSGFASF
jgi:hypothetical protein